MMKDYHFAWGQNTKDLALFRGLRNNGRMTLRWVRQGEMIKVILSFEVED